MLQQALEFQDAALARPQKIPQSREQRRQLGHDALGAFQLIGQLASLAEPLAWPQWLAQIRVPAGESIEFRQRSGTEAPCKAGTRQAQRLPDRSDSHARQ